MLLRPSDLDRNRRFYHNLLGLAICRESGPPDDPGWCFPPARSCSRSPGTRRAPSGCPVMIWIREWVGGHDQVWWRQPLPVALGWLPRA